MSKSCLSNSITYSVYPRFYKGSDFSFGVNRKRIYELEIVNGVIVGGKQQHGFMKNKSTVTAGLVLQSLISLAVDDG